MKILDFLKAKRIKIEGLDDEDTWRVGVDDDGSCFFNSICLAFDTEYREMTDKERKKFIKIFRSEIAKTFTKDLYNELLSYYEDFGIPDFMPSYTKLKKQISDPRKWVGDNVVLIVCYILEINVYIFSETGKFVKELYFGNYLDERNPSCILYHTKGVHYELVGKFVKEKKGNIILDVIFNPKDDIHQKLLLL